MVLKVNIKITSCHSNVISGHCKFKKTGKVESILEYTQFPHAFLALWHSECSYLFQVAMVETLMSSTINFGLSALLSHFFYQKIIAERFFLRITYYLRTDFTGYLKDYHHLSVLKLLIYRQYKICKYV
jgi:hypothetical protein